MKRLISSMMAKRVALLPAPAAASTPLKGYSTPSAARNLNEALKQMAGEQGMEVDELSPIRKPPKRKKAKRKKAQKAKNPWKTPDLDWSKIVKTPKYARVKATLKKAQKTPDLDWSKIVKNARTSSNKRKA